MSSSLIIAVEDSDTDFLALQYALQAAGVTNPVERCDNGRAAMDCLLADHTAPLTERASLIMLDLNLPGVDGRRLLREFRARDPERIVPVIVLSTSSHPRDIDACYRAGADAYMVKPLELEDWETKVGQLAGTWLRPRNLQVVPLEEVVPPGDPQENLRRTIETEIIPRLLLVHSGGSLPARMPSAQHFIPTEEEVAELTRLLLTHDVGVASSYVDGMRDQGATLGALFLTLFAPAAQLVGDWWREDQCDFTDMSLALSRLQHLLRDLSAPLGESTKH
jgi:CheY-like chemotaxis protein